MKFDPNVFEKLTGLQVADYALNVAKECISEPDVLPYLVDRAETMDSSHLEAALYLLASVGSEAAWQVVVPYIDHREYNVRFMATKMFARKSSVDETLMKRVVECLSKHPGDVLAGQLTSLLDRPANDEACRIANEFKAEHLEAQ